MVALPSPLSTHGLTRSLSFALRAGLYIQQTAPYFPEMVDLHIPVPLDPFYNQTMRVFWTPGIIFSWLQMGKYVALLLILNFPTDAHIPLIAPTPLMRVAFGLAWQVSLTMTLQDIDFTTRVRKRDMRCCITGEVVPQDANFVGFEAAHIFPLSEADGFHDRGYDSFITDPLVDYKGKINSVQQGLLATSVWHRRFDDYQIGINPDDGYRITDFRRREGPSPVDGRVFYIDRNCPDEFRPSAELLRDHLGQCVLANLKVAGDWSVPRFDPELHLGPGGFDLSGGWWTTDEGRAQLDAQLRATLNPWGVELQRTARFDHTEA